jgi:hypothetical protein
LRKYHNEYILTLLRIIHLNVRVGLSGLFKNQDQHNKS